MFLDSLLLKLQTVFQFKLEDYMDGMAVRAKPLRKTVIISSVNTESFSLININLAYGRHNVTQPANEKPHCRVCLLYSA